MYKIRLKTGEFSTNHLQFYNSIAEVVAAVFGDKKDNQPIKVNDMAPEQAVSELNNFFNMFGAQ